MLVTLEEILKDAEEKKYGVGLFNMLNLEMARGIIEAAEEEKSPLILGVAEVHLPLIPFEYASLVMNHIAKKHQFLYACILTMAYHIQPLWRQ